MPLPAYVREAVQVLDEAGHVAYVVGGSVRDFLLGRESKDHDIATSAGPDELCELFPNAVTVGKAFGVIKVPVNVTDHEAPVLLEIATFREDLEYQDHRRPTGVKFSGPMEDAKRRDFTINGLFYDLKTSRILDSVGGMQDLKSGVIRAIGNPNDRFKEDALRLLRAIRFTARLGFKLETETEAAILARAKLISKVSAERIRDELSQMWRGPRPDEALRMLSRLDLLAQVLPELEALHGSSVQPSPWEQSCRAMSVLARQHPVRSLELAWATVLLGVAANARQIVGRMRFSRDEEDRIVALVEGHARIGESFKMREATLQRLLRQDDERALGARAYDIEDLLALHKIQATITDGNLAGYEFCRSRLEAIRKGEFKPVPKLIDGTDLIQLGLSPGREFSEILRVVEDLAFEKKLTTKEDALEYVVRHFVK